MLKTLYDALGRMGGLPRKRVAGRGSRTRLTDFEKIYLYPNSHAGYYPGAKMLAMKVLFRKSDGRLLGAQVLGEDGVPKRIDSFAMAMRHES